MNDCSFKLTSIGQRLRFINSQEIAMEPIALTSTVPRLTALTISAITFPINADATDKTGSFA